MLDQVITEGQSIEKLADDDPPGNTKSDFSVKDEYGLIAEVEGAKHEWAVVTTGKHTARQKRTEGGRAFVRKSVGGMTTLRIMTT